MENKAFVYNGKVERLAREVAEVEATVNQAYKDVLGEEKYQRLAEATSRLLVPECYFDSHSQMNETFGENLPRNTPSKFLFPNMSGLRIDAKGCIKDKVIYASPGFYVSEESFAHSGSSQFTDRIIASYIHEFDHYALSALQKLPVFLAEAYITKKTGPVRTPQDMERLVRIADNPISRLSPDEKKTRIALGGFALALEDVYERATRILDKEVLDRIGIKTDLSWRNKPRRYLTGYSSGLNLIVQIPVDGDPFKGLSDREVMDKAIAWEKHLNPIIKTSYHDNLMKSFRDLECVLMPMPELFKKAQNEQEGVN